MKVFPAFYEVGGEPECKDRAGYSGCGSVRFRRRYTV